MPALAFVVRGQVIADVAGNVRRTGRLDQDQALGWVVDVRIMHQSFPPPSQRRLKPFLILVTDTNKSRSVI